MKPRYTDRPEAWDLAQRVCRTPAEYACALERPTPRYRALTRMFFGFALVLALVVAAALASKGA